MYRLAITEQTKQIKWLLYSFLRTVFNCLSYNILLNTKGKSMRLEISLLSLSGHIVPSSATKETSPLHLPLVCTCACLPPNTELTQRRRGRGKGIKKERREREGKEKMDMHTGQVWKHMHKTQCGRTHRTQCGSTHRTQCGRTHRTQCGNTHTGQSAHLHQNFYLETITPLVNNSIKPVLIHFSVLHSRSRPMAGTNSRYTVGTL